MKALSYFFFYTYIGLVILAGFWGAFIYPYFDFNFLFSFDPHTIDDHARINLLSQYRFLRAMEFGFGLFAIIFVQKIFEEKTFNILYLIIMASGILARVMSWIFDGTPNFFSQFFMFYELLGLIIIFFYTQKIRQHSAV
jgi:hypothetical protein